MMTTPNRKDPNRNFALFRGWVLIGLRMDSGWDGWLGSVCVHRLCVVMDISAVVVRAVLMPGLAQRRNMPGLDFQRMCRGWVKREYAGVVRICGMRDGFGLRWRSLLHERQTMTAGFVNLDILHQSC